MTRYSVFATLLVAAVLFSSCTNPLYTAAANEAAKVNAADVVFHPYSACIDRTSTIRIQFQKSMVPDTLSLSGSMKDDMASLSWSKTVYENDTLILVPKDRWNADASLGGSTCVLDFQAKDTEGWMSRKIEWRPEVVDGVIYVNADRGVNTDAGGGSATRPFGSLKYAMRAVKSLYPDGYGGASAILRMSAGSYSAETDDGALKITTPLVIMGGYSPDDWNTRDPSSASFKTDIYYPSTRRYFATVVMDEASGIGLDGLSISGTRYASSSGKYYCTGVEIFSPASVTIRHCMISVSSGDPKYASRGLEQNEGSTLSLVDSQIGIIAEAPNSLAVIALGKTSMSGCTITVQDLYRTERHSIDGIMTKSDAVIEHSSISVKGHENADLYGIVVSGTDRAPVGHVSDSSILIGDSLLANASADQTGIALMGQCNGFLLERNVVDIRGGADMDFAVNVVSSNGVLLSNNVIHAGESEYAICVVLAGSTGVRIVNNTLFTGAAAKIDASAAAFGTGVYLTEGGGASIIGNIIFGNTRSAGSDAGYGRTGVLCSSPTESGQLTVTDNVFCNLNNGLVAVSSTDTCYRTETDINIKYRGSETSGDNITVADLFLLAMTDKEPLKPTINTPDSVRHATSSWSAPAIDIQGNSRDVSFSMGAYEWQ